METSRLDLFPGPTAPELTEAHALLDQLFQEMEGHETHRLSRAQVTGLKAVRAMGALDPVERVRVVRAAVERAHWQEQESARPGSRAYNTGLNYLAENTPQHFRCLLQTLLGVLSARRLATTDTDICELLRVIRTAIPSAHSSGHEAGLSWESASSVLRLFKDHVKRNGLGEPVANEALATARFLREPDVNSQCRDAKRRKLAEQLEFAAATGV